MDRATSSPTGCRIELALKLVVYLSFFFYTKQVRRPELKIALREDVVAAPAPAAAPQVQQTHTRAAAPAAAATAAASPAAAASAAAQGSSFADEPSTDNYWYQLGVLGSSANEEPWAGAGAAAAAAAAAGEDAAAAARVWVCCA